MMEETGAEEDEDREEDGNRDHYSLRNRKHESKSSSYLLPGNQRDNVKESRESSFASENTISSVCPDCSDSCSCLLFHDQN